MPKIVNYSKGSIIFFEGDKDERVFILQSGNVALTTKDLVSGATLNERLSVGEFFGVKSALARKPRMETANVLEDSQVVQLTVHEFEQIVAPKQDVILKMLRVFSRDLRNIHHKTENMLKTGTSMVPPAEGLLTVAKAFYEEQKYHSSADTCKHLIEQYPSAPAAKTAQKLKAQAELMEQRKIKDRRGEPEPAAAPAATSGALRQFDLPMFERFSKKYKDGDVIICEFEPGECFYLIQSGEVQLEKCVTGTIKNLDILHPGEFFGEMAILDNSPRSATCIAKGEVTCLEFNKANFKMLVTGNPQIAMILLKLFCKRIYDQRLRFNILVIKDLPSRVADVFLMYDEMFPTYSELPRRRLSLTASDVAHWAGISIEQANEELSKYQSKGKIGIHDGYINVANINDMQRIVDGYFSVYGRPIAKERL